MKNKILLGLILVAILFSNINLVYASIGSYKKIDLAKEKICKYMDSFKENTVLEEVRIKNYQIQAIGDFGDEEEKISSFAQVMITPYLEDSKWKKNAIMQNYNGKVFSMIFVEMSEDKDGNYVVDYIADTPKNYDKFLEKFEEYKEEYPEALQNETQTNKEEIEKISATKNNFTSANEEITKTSNIIKICCTSAIVIVAIVILFKFTKKHCNKLIKN